MTLNLISDVRPDTLALLDWQNIIDEINKGCFLQSSRELLNRPINSKSKKTVEKQINELKMVVDRVLGDDFTHFNNLYQRLESKESVMGLSYHSLIQKLQKGHVLKLNDIGAFVLLYGIIDRLSKEKFTFFEGNEKQSRELKKFLNNISRFYTDRGDFNISKHPELAKINAKILEIEGQIRNTINELISSSHLSSSLQYQEHDVIQNRFVLPIRSDSFQSSMGDIIAHSESGLTLYVEPKKIKAISEKRIALENAMQEIIQKLCNDFSMELHKHNSLISSDFRQVERLDILQAKALYALNNNHHPPTITDDKFVIKDLKHPLIEGCVGNDISIDSDGRGLILSGPNTGGKTVILKSLALMFLMSQHGLYVCAKEAFIPTVDGIFYFGNDEQDLTQGLSSFAGEVKNYTKLFTELHGNSLVFIDEIFNSTSSEEASALAIGLFDEIQDFSDTLIFCSTHHQLLKTIVHEEKSFQSANMGFDIENETPTYKINIGLPGSSMAFNIFQQVATQHEYSSKILERAKSVIDNKTLMYEELLNEVSAKKNELDKIISENAELNKQLKNQKEANQGLLKLERDKITSEYLKKLESIEKDALKVLERAKRNEISKKNLENSLSDIKSDLKIDNVKAKRFASATKSSIKLVAITGEIQIGNKYYSKLLGKDVTIKKLNHRKKQATIASGNIGMQVPFDDLYQPSKDTYNKVKVRVDSSHRQSKTEYDCRGMRLEAFEQIIDQALIDLCSDDVPYVDIIHGHGDGVLKNWLRKHYKNHPDISLEYSETGNDGMTRLVSKR